MCPKSVMTVNVCFVAGLGVVGPLYSGYTICTVPSVQRERGDCVVAALQRGGETVPR